MKPAFPARSFRLSLIAIAFLIVFAQISASLVDGDRQDLVLTPTGESEYTIKHQDRSAADGHAGELLGINRAQDLRILFRSEGLEIVERTGVAPSWKLGLALEAVGPVGRTWSVLAAEPEVEGRQVTFVRQDVFERYENDEDGLRLTLDFPDINHEAVEAIFQISGNVELMVGTSGSEAGFYHGGRRVAQLRLADTGSPSFCAARLVRVEGGLSVQIGVDKETGTRVDTNEDTKDGGDRGPVTLILKGQSDATPQLGLAGIPSWTREGNQIGARFGTSVATAGDVNGDGFSDVIVGAKFFDDGEDNEGRAFVYLGSDDGLATATAWTAEGNQPGAEFGLSVSTAGDVNGDDYSDVVVAGRSAVSLYLGSGNGLSESPAWEVNDLRIGAYPTSGNVSMAGDVDGDGYDDVIVGAPAFDFGIGRAIVYHGSADEQVDEDPWVLEGQQDRSELGASVSTAGDVNGDGYSDVIIGAPGQGKAFVCLGSTGVGSLSSCLTLSGVPGKFGLSVSTAGDVNGDGYSDVVIGEFHDIFVLDEGRVFVYYGDEGGLLPTPWSVTVPSAAQGRVATAGDVNGDGYSDLIVGLPESGFGASGQTMLYLGSSGGLSSEPFWLAQNSTTLARFGGSVATAGDVDGDGYSDVIVGAWFFENDQNSEGRAVVYLGAAYAPANEAAWSTDLDTGARDVSLLAGDVNGDGYSDVIVGDPEYSASLAEEGRVLLFLGSADGLSPSHDWSAEGSLIPAQRLGRSVSMAGDVNGDGYSDVIVASGDGQAFAFLGSESGLADEFRRFAGQVASVSAAGDVNGDGFGDVVVGRTDGVSVHLGSARGLSRKPRWAAQGSNFGRSASTAGDVNGDGYGDLLVGASSSQIGEPDRVFAYLGSPRGLSTLPAWSVEDQSDSRFGSSVATAGDVNGDGYSDVVVGAFTFGQDAEGRVIVYLGSESGLSTSPAWEAVGGVGATLGRSVSGAGDVNGDGFSDIVVSGQDDKARVYLGSAVGLTSEPAIVLPVYGVWQREVGPAGDVNGDGFSDVLTIFQEWPFVRTGVFHGNAGGGLGRPILQLHAIDSEPIHLLGRNYRDQDQSGLTSFRLKTSVRFPADARRVRLEWEVKPLGQGFNHTDIERGQFEERWSRGLDETATLEETVDVGQSGAYHWRARLSTDSPLLPRTPWFSVPGNNITETKLRVGETSPPGFAPIGPGQTETVFADSPPLAFSWHRGEEASHFRLEWSRNPAFVSRVESSMMVHTTAGVGVYTPDADLWARILDLGIGPDIRPTSIYWRILTEYDSGVETPSAPRRFTLSAAERPTVLAPADGGEFRANDTPPTIVWQANHNALYEFRFSSASHLEEPLIAGAGFTITDTQWTLPAEVWRQVVELSRNNDDGTVYFAIFARDALNRLSWSTVRRLVVIDDEGSASSNASRRSKRRATKHR